jgi:hypothetical protein
MKSLRAKPSSAATGNLGPLLLLVAVALALLVVAVDDVAGPLVAVAMPAGAAILLASLRDYRAATCLAIFMLPVAPTSLIPHSITGIAGANLLNVVLLIAASSLLLTYALRRGRLALPRWPAPFFLYLAVFIAAAAHGAFSVDGIPDYFVTLHVIDATSVRYYLQITLINPAAGLAAAAVLSIALRNATRPRLYLIPLFAAAVVLACAVFTFAATSSGSLDELASQESRRYLSGTGLHANELGLMLNTAWALSLFCCINAERLALRIALGVVSALLLAGVALTFSRGAYLGTLAVFGYLLYLQRRFLSFALALLVLPVAMLLMPQSVTERATHDADSKDVDSLSSGRVDEIWRPLLPEILKSPLVGSGTGSIMWSEAAKEHKILPVGHPHSAYLGALLDLGVLGTVVVLLFFRHMWRLFNRLGARLPDRLWAGFFHGAAACVLLVFVQGATDDSFLPGRTQSFLWLAYGAAIGFAARLKSRARLARPAMAPVTIGMGTR